METKKEITKENLEGFLTAFSDAIEKEEFDKHHATANEIISKHGKKSLLDPEYFNLFIQNHHQSLDEVIASILLKEKYPNLESEKLSKMKDAFLHYSFMEEHLSNYFSEHEGFACSADKSHTVLQNYFKYIETGKIPVFIKEEKSYWMPQFGSGEQWMKLTDSLLMVAHGNINDYLKDYQEMMDIVENERNLRRNQIDTFYKKHEFFVKKEEITHPRYGEAIQYLFMNKDGEIGTITCTQKLEMLYSFSKDSEKVRGNNLPDWFSKLLHI